MLFHLYGKCIRGFMVGEGDVPKKFGFKVPLGPLVPLTLLVRAGKSSEASCSCSDMKTTYSNLTTKSAAKTLTTLHPQRVNKSDTSTYLFIFSR